MTLRDPEELMRAAETAFNLGGLPACEAIREPASISRRIVDAVAGAMADGWTPVAIKIMSSTEGPVLMPSGKRKLHRPKGSVVGSGAMIVTGRRTETDAELRERVKAYHRAVSAPYAPITRGTRVIWGTLEWGWCYPDGAGLEFDEAVRWFQSVVFQVVGEDSARQFLALAGTDGALEW